MRGQSFLDVLFLMDLLSLSDPQSLLHYNVRLRIETQIIIPLTSVKLWTMYSLSRLPVYLNATLTIA
jgi:hypothetical protein